MPPASVALTIAGYLCPGMSHVRIYDGQLEGEKPYHLRLGQPAPAQPRQPSARLFWICLRETVTALSIFDSGFHNAPFGKICSQASNPP
jgi:hypothetical protein